MKTIVKINHFGKSSDCKNSKGNNMGHHRPNTKWSQIDQMFHIVFPVGSNWEFKTFQKKYSSLINTVFIDHKNDYGKAMVTRYHLENGPVFNQTIELLEISD